jgi:hypothetical protein
MANRSPRPRATFMPGGLVASGSPPVHQTGLPEPPLGNTHTLNSIFNTRYGAPWTPSRQLPALASLPILQSQLTKINNTVQVKPTSGKAKLPTGLPDQVFNVSAAQSPIAVQNKTVSDITVTFSRNPGDSAYDHVNIWVKGYQGNKNWVEYATATDSPANFTLESNQETVQVAVQASSAAGQVSAAPPSCPIVAVTLSGVVSDPPAPTITQSLVGTPLGYQLAFAQIILPAGTEDVIKSYKVYRNTSANSFSGALLMETFQDDGTDSGSSIVFQDRVGGGKTYYYFVTSTNTKGLESASSSAQSGAVLSGVVDSRSTAPVNVQGITTSASAILTQSGTTKTIDVAAFTVQYGSNIGQVSYNSGSVTPGAYGQYTVYFSDPTYAGGTVSFLATPTAYLGTAADGNTIIGAITTASGGGGSGGGGGGGGEACFSPDTKVLSRRKFWLFSWTRARRFDRLKVGDLILTARRTWKAIFGIISRDYSGPMLRMWCGGKATPGHSILNRDSWTPVSNLGLFDEVRYQGKVMNLIIRTSEKADQILSPTTEHSYTLENGLVAHNILPS